MKKEQKIIKFKWAKTRGIENKAKIFGDILRLLKKFSTIQQIRQVYIREMASLRSQFPKSVTDIIKRKNYDRKTVLAVIQMMGLKSIKKNYLYYHLIRNSMKIDASHINLLINEFKRCLENNEPFHLPEAYKKITQQNQQNQENQENEQNK